MLVFIFIKKKIVLSFVPLKLKSWFRPCINLSDRYDIDVKQTV